MYFVTVFPLERRGALNAANFVFRHYKILPGQCVRLLDTLCYNRLYIKCIMEPYTVYIL